MSHRRSRACCLCLFITFRLIFIARPVAAQEPAAGAASLVRAFIDCAGFYCDLEFFRTEIAFVDHVRDRKDADVHVLLTRENTGGGGSQYTAKFMGLARFSGIDATLTHAAAAIDSSDDQRKALAQVLKLGLVRYVADSPLGPKLKVTYAPESAQTGSQNRQAGRDPWDFWVFRVGGNGFFNGEESTSSRSLSASASANRTTADWKTNLSLNISDRRSSYDLGDGEIFNSVSKSLSGSARVVKSLGPHWAAAVTGRAERSTYSNQDLAARFGGGVEYNVFPYADSTRRQLRVQWTAGINTFDYTEETVYGKSKETIADHSGLIALDLKQPWGQAGVMIDFSQYLHDLSKYQFGVYGSVDLRLFKGLSLNIGGNYARVRDQINLPKAGATDQEILVQLRQLETGYRYFMLAGISYSFGSIYNNVVNPRFGSSGGGGMSFSMSY